VYPLCSCHSAATSSAQKEVKLVKCDRKVEIFSALRGREKSLSAERKKAEKGHFFSGKIAISGHGDIQTIKTGWEVLP
jgi:hypothetical protein